MKIRFINTNFNVGSYNMAVDEVLLNSVSEGNSLPVLRFYGWNPPSVSLGYFQKTSRQISIDNCRSMGFDVVRRLTGGRAVLHDQELTYSVIFPEDTPGIPKSINESYCYFSKGLVEGFRNLGIDANLSPEATLKPSTFASAACFDAPSSYEVMVNNKKIVGSAQTRQKGVILQHGSVLNKLDVNKLFRCFDISESAFQSLTSEFRKKATSIEDERGSCASWKELCDSFSKGFASALNLELMDDSLTTTELENLENLLSKYSSDEWNFRR